MNALSKTLLALALAALMTAPASAQQQRRGGGFGGGGGLTGLLSNSGVHDELKLDDSQKSKAREIAEKAREKFASARESFENLSPQDRMAKFREITRKADAEAKSVLADVLKPEQLTRLHEIHYQVLGAAAFEDEHVQKKLDLTADQKSAVDSIVAESGRAQRELFQSGDRQSAGAKLAELRKETVSKIEAKLSDEQKAAYAKLVGAPYEVRFEGRGPGGGGRGNR